MEQKRGKGFKPTPNPSGRTVYTLGYFPSIIYNYSSNLYMQLVHTFILNLVFAQQHYLLKQLSKTAGNRNYRWIAPAPCLSYLTKNGKSFKQRIILLIIRTKSDEVKDISYSTTEDFIKIIFRSFVYLNCTVEKTS